MLVWRLTHAGPGPHLLRDVRAGRTPPAPEFTLPSRALLIDNLDGPEQGAEQLLLEVAHDAGLERAERHVAFGFAAQRLADVADEEGAELTRSFPRPRASEPAGGGG